MRGSGVRQARQGEPGTPPVPYKCDAVAGDAIDASLAAALGGESRGAMGGGRAARARARGEEDGARGDAVDHPNSGSRCARCGNRCEGALRYVAGQGTTSNAPGNNESAGKRLSGRIRKGNTLRSKYYRLKTRMGVKRAAVAIAHKILTIAYRVLADGTVYTDLGETYLDSLSKTRTSGHLVRRLEALGFRVQIEPTAA